MFNVDGQTDEHDEADNRFLAISRRRLKIHQVINFSLQKRSATCLAIQSQSWARSQASPFEICCRQRDTGTSFAPSTSGFPCLYYSTNASFSPSSKRFSYQRDKWRTPENLKKNASSEATVLWIETNFHLGLRRFKSGTLN